MTGSCCTSGGPRRPLARRVFSAVTAVLPGAALVLLPKCPLCLAAWLTVATGIGISAAAVAWTRELVVGVSIALVALAAARLVPVAMLLAQADKLLASVQAVLTSTGSPPSRS